MVKIIYHYFYYVDLAIEMESLLRFLSEPSKVLKEIPHLSRVTTARKLASLVELVVTQNDIPSWIRLLLFPKRCLRTPQRCGKDWKLATLVNKQVSEESLNIELHTRGVTTNPLGRHIVLYTSNKVNYHATRISMKLEEGDYRGAVRLACSEDVFAEHNSHTLDVLRAKHPPAPPNSDTDTLNCKVPLSISIATKAMIKKAIASFSCGSGAGIDGLLPQHLKDLTDRSAGDGGVALLSALVDFVNLILEGKTPPAVRPIFFGASLTALTNKSGDICPIAVGCTLRRLASKCACQNALKTIPPILTPHQVGFGIAGGVEAAVHASRVYLTHLPNEKAMLKVDFKNAFNSIRRDKMLKAVKLYVPNLLPFVSSAYSSPSILLWHGAQILSGEGIQQGDPISPMLFCLTIQELVSSLSSEFIVFYLDNGTIGGNLADLQADFQRIEDRGQALGLHLNVNKSELVSYDESAVRDVLSVFPGLQFISAHQATLLDSPLGKGAMKECLEVQLHQLKAIGERLCHLQTRDAITVLRHLLSIPNLLHILRTSPAFESPLLVSWDNLLMSIVSRITNITFSLGDSSWIQATLPVKSGGLGFRSVSNLAPSAFLASADGVSELMQQLLPAHLSSYPYNEKDSALSAWERDLPGETPLPTSPSHQKSWDTPKIEHLFGTLLSDPDSRSRLLEARSSGSGARVSVPPVSSRGLRMSNDKVRIAIGLRLGVPVSVPHTSSVCVKEASTD